MKDYYQMTFPFHQFIYEGKSNRSITDIKLSHFKRERENFYGQSKVIGYFFPCSHLGKIFFQWFFFFALFTSLSPSTEPNSIVRSLRESRFPFCGFPLYILSRNRYVKNNSRIHTIPANESARMFQAEELPGRFQL